MRASWCAVVALLFTACSPAFCKGREAVSASAVTPPVTAATPQPLTEGMGVRLRGTVETSRQISIAVANAGSSMVQLASALRVERFVEREWEELDDVHNLLLRADCEAAENECMSLVPGAELYPPNWLGLNGDAQCECAQCARVPSGTYRFVAHSCDGERVYRGEPFSIGE